MKETIAYYNEHAEEYVKETFSVSMKYPWERFLFYVPEGGRILDLGCGSGRDVQYFMEKGYDVSGIDGSEEMVRCAKERTGGKIETMLFSEWHPVSAYEGIWACASLLHLKKEELREMISKILDALVNDGIFYASFKYGTFEGERNGRYFTDLDIGGLYDLLHRFDNAMLLECWQSKDVRNDRKEEIWLNCIVRKTKPGVKNTRPAKK